MKKHRKIIVCLLLTAMLIGYIPAVAVPASAAAGPVLALGANTAVNPILDHTLSADLFSTGGPFTVSFEWKACTIMDNDPTDPGAAHAFVGVVGTINGTSTDQSNPGLTITGHTDWQAKSFTFQNVGTYNMGGSVPGNILRFGLWKATGELQIRNLVITDASGAVKYDLNTDPVVAQAVSNMQSAGITERDLSVLQDIDYDNCPWMPGQFGAGTYYAFLRCELPQGGTTTTTTPTTLSTTIPSSAPSPSTGLVGVPTYANIATNKEAYDVNEDVMFSFQTDGDTNTLHVSRVDGQWENTYTGLGDSYKLSFGWAGEYRALVEAVSSRGYYLSEPVYFTIGAEPVAPTTVPTTNTTRPTTVPTTNTTRPTTVPTTNTTRPTTVPTTAPGTPTTTTVRCPDGHFFIKDYCVNCQIPAAAVVEIRTDKSVYNQGDKIVFIMTGDGYNSVLIQYPDGTALLHPGVVSNYTIIAEQIGQYTIQMSTGIGKDLYYSEQYSFNVIAGPTTEPTTPTNPNECPDGHTYLKGVCYYCGAKDPCHDCTYNGHNFSQGVCIFCDTPDPSVTKPTTRPTTVPTTAPGTPTTTTATTAAPTIKPTTTVPTTRPTTAATVLTTSKPVLKEFVYTGYSSDGIYITDYNGYGGDVVIPDTIDGYKVIGIDEYAFAQCDTLTSVVIPEGVTEIRLCAFQGCTNMTSVVIPNSVTAIHEAAFEGCKVLTTVTLGKGVSVIGEIAFENCPALTNVYYSGTKIDKAKIHYNDSNEELINAEWHYADPNEDDYDYTVSNGEATITAYLGYGGDVIIPSTLGGYPVTTIDKYAFMLCDSLTSVTIPNTVTTIADYVFKDCFSLTAIDVAANNPVYTSVNGVLFNKNKTTLVQYPAGKIGAYTIPNSVTAIGELAFYYCTSLTSVTIPNSVNIIGDMAFHNCTSLTSVTIPNSVTAIGYRAFISCTSLTAVIIPDSVITIGYEAFDSCTSLTAVTIPNSITEINDRVFACCTSLTALTIPNSVTSIGDWAFFGCKSLTALTIPDSVTSIGAWAFEKCSSLTAVTIPNSITIINNGAFSSCKSLTSVTIPNSVTTIGKYAFDYCKSLTSVSISNTVTRIGTEAFAGCIALCDVYYSGILVEWEEITIGSGNSNLLNATLHCKQYATITTQPKDVCVANGKTASVKVTATGDGLTYKWYYKDAGATSYKLTTSFKGNTYSVTMTDARAGRRVLCKVYDKYGNMVQSKSALLSQAVRITKQPVDICVANGEKATVKVVAKGDGLTYKWYYKDKGMDEYKYTSSFTTNTYSVTMTDARAGRRVLCKVYDKYGNMVQSKSVVLSQSVRIAKQSATATVSKGSTAKITVTAVGDGLTYKWYYKNVGATKFSLTTSFTGNTYSVKMDGSRNGRQVYCVVTDQYGNSVQSKTVTLKMK